jgi:hypothetical protein
MGTGASIHRNTPSWNTASPPLLYFAYNALCVIWCCSGYVHHIFSAPSRCFHLRCHREQFCNFTSQLGHTIKRSSGAAMAILASFSFRFFDLPEVV